MKTMYTLCAFLTAAIAALAQTPVITAVENAATNIQPGLPNAPIAQGSMFVVKGSNLGPSTIVIATTFPLPTNQAGTSVQVTVAGKSVAGIMYYTLNRQIAAVLPSTTPAGTGTLTVTYNGATSAPAPITVVSNNIGVFTVAATGSGDAIATLPNGTIVSPVNAPNPGDTVALWGTGLGAVAGDESQPATGGNLVGIPLEVFIGGQSATILYRGRNACCTSVDTVYVTIPQGVGGCAVSVIMQIGSLVSNATTIPVAVSGHTCTPTNPAISSSQLTQLLAKTGPLAVGGLSLTRTISSMAAVALLPGGTTKSDQGSGRFVRYAAPPAVVLDSVAAEVLSYGSCSVIPFQGTTPDPLALLSPTYLDAGASLSVSGPNGAQSMAKTGSQGGILYNGKFDSTATYLSPGSYTITGPGGPDVGSFSVNLTVPQPVVWSNQPQVTSVSRSQGVTVNWTGGDPNGYVFIVGISAVGTSTANAIGAGFTCAARTSDGKFTVPPNVLLALPASGTVSGFTVPGTLGVYGNSAPVPFSATGLDLAVATETVIDMSTVVYQ